MRSTIASPPSRSTVPTATTRSASPWSTRSWPRWRRPTAIPRYGSSSSTGAGGKAFSSGYDIKELAEKPKRTVARLAGAHAEGHRVHLLGLGLLEARHRHDRRLLPGRRARVRDVLRHALLLGRLHFAALEARFSNGIATLIMPWLIGQRSRRADLQRRHHHRRRRRSASAWSTRSFPSPPCRRR